MELFLLTLTSPAWQSCRDSSYQLEGVNWLVRRSWRFLPRSWRKLPVQLEVLILETEAFSCSFPKTDLMFKLFGELSTLTFLEPNNERLCYECSYLQMFILCSSLTLWGVNNLTVMLLNRTQECIIPWLPFVFRSHLLTIFMYFWGTNSILILRFFWHFF